MMVSYMSPESYAKERGLSESEVIRMLENGTLFGRKPYPYGWTVIVIGGEDYVEDKAIQG